MVLCGVEWCVLWCSWVWSVLYVSQYRVRGAWCVAHGAFMVYVYIQVHYFVHIDLSIVIV